MDDYIRQTLTISVAQIIENIGWHSITDSSMKIITDILHHYISDLSVTSKKYAEHAYNDVPDIEDVEKAFRQKSISLNELRRYMRSTGPVKFPHNLPELKVPGKNVFNSIKPGSREIVTRPIHIHEHLPTLNAEPTGEEKTTDTEQIQNSIQIEKEETEEIILHKRLREISSVVMTSGGFLSPSREGRLAESKLLPFPEIKNDLPLDTSKSSLPNSEKKSSRKMSTSKKKIKTKKLKSGIKKKQKGSKIQPLLILPKEKKPEVSKTTKKFKEETILSPKEPVPEPFTEEIDIVSVTDEVQPLQVPKIIIPTPQTNKVKLEEVLPKFSFFGPLSPSPELIPSTFSPIITPDKIEKPASPILKIENEDLSRKEQKKKKKDKKKEKKEKKKQKEKVKEKEKVKGKEKLKEKLKEKEKIKEKEEKREKPREKIKCTNKVPKIKLRFGARMDKVTKVLPVDKQVEENITIVTEPEPMDVDVDVESKSDISIDVLQDQKSPPKVPIQKIKTKIVTKTVQPIPEPIPPVVETPPAFYFDEAGNQVWICPMCTKPDDGSPMIGCDGCDVWYHWVCVGIQCPPDCAVWYCPRCLAKRAQQPKGKRGRPRKNKS